MSCLYKHTVGWGVQNKGSGWGRVWWREAGRVQNEGDRKGVRGGRAGRSLHQRCRMSCLCKQTDYKYRQNKGGVGWAASSQGW